MESKLKSVESKLKSFLKLIDQKNVEGGAKKSASYRVSSNCLGGGPHTNQRHTLFVVAVRMCTCQGKGNIWRWQLFGLGVDEKCAWSRGNRRMETRMRCHCETVAENSCCKAGRWVKMLDYFFRQQCVLHCSVPVGGIAVLRHGHWNTDFALIVEKFWWPMQVPRPKSDRHSSEMTRAKE